MCTLVLAWQVVPETPVVVAANRDESFDRPSVPPKIIETEPRILAPRDAEAGGTWIGVNEFGVCVAITNRWNDADLAGERSRGLLVRDALARESAEDAARLAERAVESHEYAGFNLTCVDADAALVLEWDGRLRTESLDSGVHVVMNVGRIGNATVPSSWPERGHAQVENGRAVREALRVEPGEPVESWRDRAADVLGDHDYGVCVHGDGFGTRSSSLLTIHENRLTEYAYADGPPCRTAFEPVEGQI